MQGAGCLGGDGGVWLFCGEEVIHVCGLTLFFNTEGNLSKGNNLTACAATMNLQKYPVTEY